MKSLCQFCGQRIWTVNGDGTASRHIAHGDECIRRREAGSQFCCTPQQYHAGLDRLWRGLGLTGVQDDDVFTLCERELLRLKEIERAVVKVLDDLRAAPELNPRNFSEDDAMRLNDTVEQAFADLESAILGKEWEG